jgi:hypothetical protein
MGPYFANTFASMRREVGWKAVTTAAKRARHQRRRQADTGSAPSAAISTRRTGILYKQICLSTSTDRTTITPARASTAIALSGPAN